MLKNIYRVRIEEYSDIKTVAALASFITEHGELGAELISHYGDLESAEKALSDCYAGSYDSLKDFAQSITEDTTEIPASLEYYIDYDAMACDRLEYYIDYDAMARDLEINDVIAIELGYDDVHVFWNR